MTVTYKAPERTTGEFIQLDVMSHTLRYERTASGWVFVLSHQGGHVRIPFTDGEFAKLAAAFSVMGERCAS